MQTMIWTAAVDVTVTVAAGTDETWELGPVPDRYNNVEIDEAYLLNNAALTGHATNYTTFDIYNTTDAVAMASRAVDTVTTDNVTANAKWSITVSTTTANKKAGGGDELRARKTDTGTGMAITAPARIVAHFLVGTED